MTKTIIDYLKTASETLPKNTALICAEDAINYQELDRLSEKIALGLRALGIVQGDNIGIYMNKSIAAIVSIYAILKLGCCYVPISTDSPNNRTSGIIKNCAIQHILIQDSLAEKEQRFFQEMGVNCISSKLLLEAVKINKQQSFISPQFTGKQAAAILHTSGTTGVPKGAVITHQNLSVFTSWAVSAFNLQANDNLLSHAPLQFDLSFFDIFAAVAASATIVLATSADTSNAARMINLVTRTNVTVWQSVPSALTLQVISKKAKTQPQTMPSVRSVIFAGERMPRSTLLGIAEQFPKARFYNIYGCTETNNTFMYPLPKKLSDAPDPLPIGKALPHIRYRIVDSSGSNVIPGSKGHLLVAGKTIMAGYIALDKNGSPAYHNNNCSNAFYPTNDMVSEQNKDELHFHGRLDNIIKSNGYRINLTEIEDHLQQSHKFVEVAVLSEPDQLIGNRIIAIVKPKSTESCSILELKLFCAETLPKYAIPHRFYLSSNALPKGSTGKIDKRQVAKMWQLA